MIGSTQILHSGGYNCQLIICANYGDDQLILRWQEIKFYPFPLTCSCPYNKYLAKQILYITH